MSEVETQPKDYSTPVSQLLTLGKPTGREPETWLDYIELYGFAPEHIPELIRLVQDESFWDSEYEKRSEIYAFVHALRVLGQLQDEGALPFLIELAETEEYSDWIWEALPYVIAMIGPVAIPMLKDSLERMKGIYTGLTVIDCFEKMAIIHPETKAECIAILSERLEKAEENDEGVNASIISTLVDFKAMESLPLIEQAFAANRVDLMVMGDWDDVQVELGLKAPDPNKRRRLNPLAQQFWETAERITAAKRNAAAMAERKAKIQKKKKRKIAKKTRKQNRRKRK